MTPEFLPEVAKVYRENFEGNPTKAVAVTFNVQSRMASKYVDAAEPEMSTATPRTPRRGPRWTA